MSARKGVTVKKYAILDDALGGLNRAEVDAVVGDEPFLTYSSVNSYQNTMLLQTLVNKYQYAVVVRKTEPELLKKINETIDRMKAAGDLKKLDETWMGNVRKQAAASIGGVIEDDKIRKAAKTISVNITKLSGEWDMSRLDGFVLVLNGTSGAYQSTPILTDGNKGNCKFTRPVPPGEYMLNLSILKMTAKVPVPPLPKLTLTLDLKIAKELTIQFK